MIPREELEKMTDKSQFRTLNDESNSAQNKLKNNLLQRMRTKGLISQFSVDIEQLKAENDKNLPSFRPLVSSARYKIVRDEKINIFSKNSSAQELPQPTSSDIANLFTGKAKVA